MRHLHAGDRLKKFDRDKALIAALSKPEGQQNRVVIEALRKQIGDIEGRLAVNTARLEKDFPGYAALANPKPLKAEEVQKLLGTEVIRRVTHSKKLKEVGKGQTAFCISCRSVQHHAVKNLVVI